MPNLVKGTITVFCNMLLVNMSVCCTVGHFNRQNIGEGLTFRSSSQWSGEELHLLSVQWMTCTVQINLPRLIYNVSYIHRYMRCPLLNLSSFWHVVVTFHTWYKFTDIYFFTVMDWRPVRRCNPSFLRFIKRDLSQFL